VDEPGRLVAPIGGVPIAADSELDGFEDEEAGGGAVYPWSRAVPARDCGAAVNEAGERLLGRGWVLGPAAQMCRHLHQRGKALQGIPMDRRDTDDLDSPSPAYTNGFSGKEFCGLRGGAL
jgi:hypothetical protein